MGAQAATVFDVSGSAQTEHGVKRVRGWFGGAQFTLTLLQKCRDWRRRAQLKPTEHGGWDLRRGALPRRTASQPRGQVRDHLVGVEGFEPPTSNSQSSRSTNLSYTPRPRILTRDFAPATAFVLHPNSPAGTTTLFRKMPCAMPHGRSRAIKPPFITTLLKPNSRSRQWNGWRFWTLGASARDARVLAPRFRSAPWLCTHRRIE